MTSVDIISDLHQDYWDMRLNFTSPSSGDRSHAPFDLVPTPGVDTLIVAGDISDDMALSLAYLKIWKLRYKHVLFVDGNHEHKHVMPRLYSSHTIGNEMKKPEYKGIFYLPTKPFMINHTAFIGISGWWNYYGGKGEDDKNLKVRIIQQASLDCAYLKQMLYHLEINTHIERIVVITHAVPTKSCTHPEYIGREYNGLMQEIIDSGEYKKLTHWIFGHTHTRYNKTENGIKLVCNPRGTPGDYGRVFYKQETLVIPRVKSKI